MVEELECRDEYKRGIWLRIWGCSCRSSWEHLYPRIGLIVKHLEDKVARGPPRKRQLIRQCQPAKASQPRGILVKAKFLQTHQSTDVLYPFEANTSGAK